MVYATKESVFSTGTGITRLVLVIIVARDVGEEIERPGKQLAPNQDDRGDKG